MACDVVDAMVLLLNQKFSCMVAYGKMAVNWYNQFHHLMASLLNWKMERWIS